MIPERIDCLRLILELNANGWKTYKIEAAIGVPKGHLAKIKSENIQNPRYEVVAKLHNFHSLHVPCGTEKNQSEEKNQPLVVAP